MRESPFNRFKVIYYRDKPIKLLVNSIIPITIAYLREYIISRSYICVREVELVTNALQIDNDT